MQRFVRAFKKCDKVLLVNTFLLFILGATIHYSLNLGVVDGTSVLIKHLVFIVIAVIGFAIVMTIDYRFWQPLYPWMYLISLVLLVLIFSPVGEVI